MLWWTKLSEAQQCAARAAKDAGTMRIVDPLLHLDETLAAMMAHPATIGLVDGGLLVASSVSAVPSSGKTLPMMMDPHEQAMACVKHGVMPPEGTEARRLIAEADARIRQVLGGI